jgi:DNA-3-methyladenine glycosylase II
MLSVLVKVARPIVIIIAAMKPRKPKAETPTVPVKPADRWRPALLQLRRVDPHLKQIIERVGPCGLEPGADRFGTLVRAIIGQQISTKAAASIHTKLLLLSDNQHHPARLLELGEPALRGVGLSGVKARYVLNLSEAVHSGAIPLDAMDETWDDATITTALTSVKGIGVWTAEMFLIFSLNRPDVLPASDLGVRVGIRDRFGLDHLPTVSECITLTNHWRPYRSVASWYLWRSLDSAKPKPAE